MKKLKGPIGLRQARSQPVTELRTNTAKRSKLKAITARALHGSRTLKKGENLKADDCCFVCGLTPNGVIRKGTMYRPVCWDCRNLKNAVLAKEIETLVEHSEAEELDDYSDTVAGLVCDILYDYGNETRVFATHPKLIRLYVITMLEVLPRLDEHSRKSVERGFRHIRELMAGCSKARLEEIDSIHNPAHATEETENTSPNLVPIGTNPQGATSTMVDTVDNLREKLAALELVPENEAIALQLESEIYRLERETDHNEWPDVIE